MKKEWACLLCGRFGDLVMENPVGLSRMDLAIKQYFAMCAGDEQVTARMRKTHKGFIGPSPKCSGRIELSASQRKPAPAADTGILGGDEPWI